MNNKIIAIALAGGAAILIISIFIMSHNKDQSPIISVSNFEECAAAGYPVMESYPEQCRTPDGQTFVRQIPEVTSPDAIAASAAVRVEAAKKYSLRENEVIILEITAKEWPDSCLGIAPEGEACLQVITPGFEIRVDMKGEEVVYHTNKNGSVVREFSD